VRRVLLGPGERRQIADLRRSGSTEALAGGTDPAHLASKMANSISQRQEGRTHTLART
jgi:hypothetical protein